MKKIVVFVPEDHKSVVKKSMFSCGGGKIGTYDCCSFEMRGMGQFRPLKGSEPFIGTENTVEQVVEYKIEMVCEDHLVKKVVQAMKDSHPYETPAYEVYEILDY